MRFLARSIASLVLFVSVVQFPLFAQEKVSPEDLLRWLPDQPYRLMEFTDYAAQRKAEIWDFAPSNYYNRDQGGWFIKDVVAKLTAVPLIIQWRGEGAPPTYGDMAQAEEMISGESPEVLKGYELARREVRILVFEDVEPVVKEAVELGVLAPYEEGYHGYDLYQMSRPVTHDKTGRWIATAVDGRYLFLAPSVKQIQRMLDTNGQADNSAYRSLYMEDLLARLDDLGQHWSYQANGLTMSQMAAAIAEANGWPPEALKRVREKQRYKRLCSISTDVYGEQWRVYTYYIFDTEIALQDSEDARNLAPVELGTVAEYQPMPPEMEFQVRIDGNVIVHSHRRDVYAKQQWQRIKEMREKIRASRGRRH